MATIIRYAIQTIILAAVWCTTTAGLGQFSLCVPQFVWRLKCGARDNYYMMIARAVTRTLMNGHFVRSWGRDGVLYTLFHPSYSHAIIIICYIYGHFHKLSYYNPDKDQSR